VIRRVPVAPHIGTHADDNRIDPETVTWRAK
jgi:hypothetical protein